MNQSKIKEAFEKASELYVAYTVRQDASEELDKKNAALIESIRVQAASEIEAAREEGQAKIYEALEALTKTKDDLQTALNNKLTRLAGDSVAAIETLKNESAVFYEEAEAARKAYESWLD